MAALLFGCALAAGVTAADTPPPTEWQLFVRADSIAFSEPYPVYSTFTDLNAGSKPGDTAFTHDQVDIGASYGPWTLASIKRYDFYLSFHPDAAELLYRGENDLPVERNRQYTINTLWNHASSTGLKASYTFNPHDRLKLRLAASFLRAEDLLHGSVAGASVIDANEDFGGDVILDYRYSRDGLLDRQVDEPDGNGYAVDVYVNWRASERLTIAVAAEDWLNAIRWRDAPFTQAALTSSTVSLDDNGSISTTPLLSGTEGYRDFTQKLPVRTSISMLYRANRQIEVVVQALNVESLNLPAIGVRYHRAPDKSWALAYDSAARAVTMSLETGWWHVSVGLDHLNVEKAHFVSIGAGVHKGW
jgi:hypothetical protein